ncbi:NodT family efflux transporter outer membrane factor (OMF) lipoprotein [Actimicrobium sp. GrIS 1.19]|uniref:efflux transporter outer membrane subunit n=1 Tax=Actimicrobium sp. GrIS 1.19 TaxID=3071708 RepID=UPI002DF9AD84|nr:NodT family efflux transporter outer membrane factor (OMF) lipoprotein [Actimicrobium sp. GrIS 1.19]
MRALSLLILLLAGCTTVGPDYLPPVLDAPADWADWHGGAASLADPQLRQQTGAVRDITTLFDDPVLVRLQTRALAANPDLQTAALRFAQSRTQRKLAAAQNLQVNARGAESRQRQSEFGSGTRLIDAIAPNNRKQLIGVLSAPFDLYQGGFDASWELDLWGHTARVIEAADANVTGSLALLDQARLAVLGEVTRNYVELRGTQRQLQLLQADIAVGAEALELVTARVKGGLGTELDVIRASNALANQRARLPGLQDDEAQHINQLTLLTAQTPGALQTELLSAAAPLMLPDLRLGVPSELALRRPDIRSADAALHAATANIGVATADLYPRITLGASAGLESVGANHFGDWGSRQWSIGPSLTLPLFDQGRRRSAITLRQLEQQQAAVAYQQTVLKAWHEIDSALTSYTAEQQHGRQLDNKENSSRIADALADARYRQGMTDYLAALEARHAWLMAQSEAARSFNLLAVQMVSIVKVLGGTVPDRQ